MPQAIEKQTFRKVLARNIALPLISGLITSVIFVVVINLLIDQTRQVEQTDRVIANVNAGFKSFVDAETGLRGYLLTGRDTFLEPYISAKTQVPHILNTIRDSVNDNKIQQDRIVALQGLHQNWLEYAQKMKGLRDSGKSVGNEVAQGLGKSIMDESRDLFDRMIALEERLRRERADSLLRMTQVIVIVVVTISLVISVLIAIYGRRQLFELSGNYEKAIKATQDQNQYLQHQQWLKTAQTELSEKMLVQRSLGGLADTVIGYISYYLNAQVGAFYVTTGDKVLERKGTYAYFHEFAPPKSLQFGESLVGQTAAQKQILHLTKVPHDYIKVSSGTGSASPAELALVPIYDGGDVLGVIELGFLGNLDTRFRDFFDSINEGISTALRAAQFREQREKLLKEIQNQAEELQTQQEELRSMNEELEEQTQNLKSSQTKLEAQHVELEQNNQQLSKQASALEEAKFSVEQKALELQRASQYKSEFLANMSHELRTPLNSSLILAKLLSENKEKNLTPQQIDFAKQILNSGNDLLNLINDILDLSKVESGKLDVHPDQITIDSIVTNMKRAFDPMAKEKGLLLEFSQDPSAPKSIYSDRLRLEQILKNLLSNALKFTAKGSIKIQIRAAGAGDTPQDWVQFAVIDTGIGIKPEQHKLIFEAFRQADGTTTRKYGGTGLGLAICRDLSRLLGGYVEVESSLNEGSTFTLTLPKNYGGLAKEVKMVASEKQKEGKIVSKTIERKEIFFQDDRDEIEKNRERNILVAEDDIKFAKILFDLAHEQKYKCIVTDSAEEAVELAKKYQPSAVILDINLTDQHGLFALDQLKSSGETRHIPVHVISATDFSRQALHLGAMGYMLKPVKREQLVEAFDKIKEKIDKDVRKILILEDDTVQRNAIRQLIEDKNLEITAVGTGAEAYDLLTNNSFDCMIMDLNLTDMSGFDLLEKMNSGSHPNYPPIIVYTGRSLTREEEMQLNRYSRSVIIKGAKSPERLLDEVALFLHRVEAKFDEKKKEILADLRHREKTFDGKTIMIVDDDMRNTFALTAALEEKGARIIIARNGRESLQRLEEEDRIDLVLMDIMMPVMDGYEATREIRQNVRFKKLPIIALTAKAMKDDRQRCIEAGTNDYLPKPVNMDKLISLTRIWLTAGWS